MKPTFTRGILSLGLTASLFLGCQDFLGEDKAAQAAKTSAEEGLQPVPPASTQDAAVECKEIFAQMQTAKDPLYGELKNRFGSQGCDITQFTTPAVPPDSATICRNYKTALAEMDPTSPKYPMYQEQIAIYCTDGTGPAVAKDLPLPVADPATPVAPAVPVAPVTPAPPEMTAECKDLQAQMQTAKDPLYGELKDRFVGLKCDVTMISTPPVPPDAATICRNYQAALAEMDPGSSKYPMYLEQIAVYCK